MVPDAKPGMPNNALPIFAAVAIMPPVLLPGPVTLGPPREKMLDMLVKRPFILPPAEVLTLPPVPVEKIAARSLAKESSNLVFKRLPR